MISHRRTRRSAAFALLLGAMLIAGILPAAAQGSAPATTPEPNATPDSWLVPNVEMVGFVQAVTVDTITVNGQTIDTSAAEMNVMPVIGAAVKVEGTLDSSGAIVAREVKTLDPLARGLQPGEVELVGPLTAMTNTRLTIAGFPMDATNAEFGPGVGLGQLVKVHATLNANNQWIVREVELATADDAAGFSNHPNGEFEITGTLSEVGDSYIVVNGQRISTDGAEINGLLVPGALVKVHLSLVNGEWVAREVELADSSDDSTSDEHSGSNDDHSGSGSDNSGSGSDDSGSHDSGDDHGSDNSGSGSDDSGSHDSGADHGGDNSGSGSDDSGSHDSGDDHGGDNSGSGSDDSGSHDSGDD